MERIDIEDILRRRTGKRFGPLVGYILRKLVHQRELNEIWDTGRTLTAPEFLDHTLAYLKTDFETVYTGDIPQGEGYIFVSNHPFGGLDGMMIASAIHKRFGDVGVVVNDLLMNVRPLAPLWIPVNKYGRQGRGLSDEYARALESPAKQIMTFPAGFCSRKINGQVIDTEWKPRFVKDALHYGRKVVPVYVDGTLSRHFYAIHSLRTALGIKVNIELALLVDEMFRQRGRHIRIVFGTPVDIAGLEGSADDRCRQIRELVYSLKSGL